jgi:DNA-binding transcriptional LysR family regulator
MAFARFTPRQLDAFVSVADLRSFSAAGQRLGLTPSAVSQLVAELESVLGFRLFERTTRVVALSPAGRQFLGSAEQVLRHIALAESAAADVLNRAAGIVRIAAPLVIASSILPPAIKDYGQQRPKVVVRIRDTLVEGLVERVASADVDLALGPDRATGSDVERTPLFGSPWVIWCAPDHPLAATRQSRWADLRNHSLIAAGRDHELNVSKMRAVIPDDERIAPIDVVDNITTALGIAAQGLACTLAPAYVGALAIPMGLVMRRVTHPEVMREFCIYQSTQRVLSPAAEGFRDHLVAWLRARKDLGTPRRGRPGLGASTSRKFR